MKPGYGRLPQLIFATAVMTSMTGYTKNDLKRARLAVFIVLLTLSLTFFAIGCGSGDGTTTGDSPNSLLPDYQQPIQRAKDAANQTEQEQKQIEDNSEQLLQNP
ncbi:MAG: hypothetical protein JJD96_03610 [Thermoleophilia bacterium]|nr:hypothetical protein [Thermoleophilia bacterium]